MKVNRSGQGAIISEGDYQKIRRSLPGKKYKLLLDIARYTGERWGAIVQLRVLDVFDVDGDPRPEITFRASTRKADPNGARHTRQVPVHPLLAEILETVAIDSSDWLFPSRVINGHHITLRAADLMFRAALRDARLTSKGYCTHSTRRTFITRLWESGVDLHTIQILTGHHDTKSLVRYIEANPERIKKAIALL